MPTLAPAELEKRLGTIRGTLPLLGKKDTLSIAMIVKNEEKNIEAAIRSFMPFADEIVVNDTGSTDKTLEILSRLPVKIIQHPWEGDFSTARNQALSACSCSWILWLDADDRIPPESIEDIKALKTAPLDRCFGFQVINTQAGAALGARFYQTRMFPNHPKIRFERRVHEQIIYSIAALGLHSMFVETQILHTGYEDENLKKSKSKRNLELMLGDPDYLVDPILPMQVGDAYSILEEWEKAIEAYQTAYNIPNCKEIQLDAWMEIPNSIGRAYQSLGDYTQAEHWFQLGLEAKSGKLEPVYFLAELRIKQNRPLEALGYLRTAVEMPRSHSSVANQYDVLKIHSFHQLCRILASQAQYPEVVAYAQKFYQEYPQVVESLLHLAKAELSLKQFRQAFDHAKEVVQSSPQTREAWEVLLFAAEGSGMNRADLESLRKQGADYFPEFHTGSRPDLSIAMIVKNEEKSLPQCLASIQGLWDQLIVVDTGSTDQTVAIAKSYGAEVHYFEWVQDFSAARNVSLSKCTGRWILWLDADDVVPLEEIARIKSLTREVANKAYGFLIQNTTDDGLTGQCFSQIRLFPNQAQIRFEGKVHEQVLEKIKSAGVSVEFKTLKIHHTGYMDDETVRAKQRRNLEIMLAEGGEHPENLTSVKQYSIAGAYQDLLDFPKAIEWYHKAEARARRVGEDPHVKEYAPVKVAQCLFEMNQLQEAKDSIGIFLGVYPFNPEARLLEAMVLDRLGEHDSALSAYVRLFAFEEFPCLMPVDFKALKFKAVHYLGHDLHKKGFMEAAVQVMRLGKKFSEGQALSSDQIISILFEIEWYTTCLDLLEFESRMRSHPDVDLQRSKVLIMLNQLDLALEILKDSHQKHPYHYDIKQLLDLVLSESAD